MNRAMLVTLLVLFGAVAAAEEPGLPIGPLPQFGLAQIADGGRLEISHCISRPVYETREKEVEDIVKREINGQIVEQRVVRTVTYTTCRWVSDMRVRAFEPKVYRVAKDGTEVAPAAAAKLLAKPTPVVFLMVSGFHEEIHPFYVQFFKPGTVVIRVQQPPQPPADAPAP
jgi:hypothetical protein